MTEFIPFNKPYMTGSEQQYIALAHARGMLAGDGPFTELCQQWFEQYTGASKVLLTHSCTSALEMAALLLDIKPGDEVIVPSYTFVSSANAFVLFGAKPVFVDIREDTLNINESLIEDAITAKTRAIVPVHYAGVSAEMDIILSVAQRYGVSVIEDAAQGCMARYRGRMLGSMGDFGAYSFHETKNLICGEGGALLINREDRVGDAEIIWEKGTDRSSFFRGEVDRYTWQSIGSSYLPGELSAAFLYAQIEQAEQITAARLKIWNYYHNALQPLENAGLLRRPTVPNGCEHNGHMYYILLSPHISRQAVIDELKKRGIGTVFHYVPLHSSPAGRRYGRAFGNLKVTEDMSERVLRLPLWVGLTEGMLENVVCSLQELLLRAA